MRLDLLLNERCRLRLLPPAMAVTRCCNSVAYYLAKSAHGLAEGDSEPPLAVASLVASNIAIE
ncbi:UNVERIFIED_CONTAM: hypothetical protein Sradi_0697700 [Sesamum radiatum]|uniref:Uncharacterized protein n=1 Tax=Sesamum radiatum TaxID=300843 RepID=A0AAW2VNA0_SESRA